jgi:putative thioredoxin
VIVDVTDTDFADAVLEESRNRPVVVDFWAAWCAPCRTLGPILEKVAREKEGQFLLAKLDVDANPYTAGQFRIQSIPSVKAFVDGRLVDEFLGAIPEPVVRQWVDRLLPSEADRTADRAEEAERAGRLDEAERQYREALERDPENPAARLGLGRVLTGRGELEQAREVVSPLLPDPEAERVLAAIRVAEWSSEDATSLGQTSGLAAAGRLAAEGRWREALDGMLALVKDDPEARQAILDVFAVLGEDDPLTREYRAKLANALF